MSFKTALKYAVAVSVAANFTVSSALAAGEVNLLTWEGYADASFIDPFEAETGCTVTAAYVGSNDDFAAKLAGGGGVYDMISPSIDTTSLMIDAGFVEPIDTARIDEWNNLYEKFRTADGINRDGQTYGVPFVWGAIAFMYRVDKFDTPPTSLNVLWDEKLAGRISLWDDKSSLYVAARHLGDTNIYHLSDEQIAAARDSLIAQKPLVRKYWATAGELVDLFVADEVWISNTWAGYQSSLIAEQGIEVREFIPVENAEGWMDSWMIVKDTPNAECAYKFLNMMSAQAGQCGTSAVTGYSVANPVAARACMTPEQFDALHQDDPNYLDALLLWEPLGDRLEAYTNAWNAVKSSN